MKPRKLQRDNGILFSTSMVRALLDGRKTMTRRLYGLDFLNEAPDTVEVLNEDDSLNQFVVSVGDMPGYAFECPYGAAGSTFWVRETWRLWHGDPIYRATPPRSDIIDFANIGWKPSIHMPRKHSRLKGKISGVRLERLQSMPDQDIYAEGVMQPEFADKAAASTKRLVFRQLWNAINGKSGYTWEFNPWVWVLSLEVTK